jgi:hypothetical protein
MADAPPLRERLRRLRKALAFYGWHLWRAVPRCFSWLIFAQEQIGKWAILLWIVFVALVIPYEGVIAALTGAPWEQAWAPAQRGAILVVIGGLYIAAFFAGIWSDFQNEQKRIEQLGRQVTGFQDDIAKSADAAKGAYISIGVVNPRISRGYDPRTRSLSGPVYGVEIRVASARLIAGKDPLAIKAHLEIQLGDEVATVMPLGFIAWRDGSDIPTVLPEHTVPAGTGSDLVMRCDIKESVSENAEAKLLWVKQAVKRVVVWDCLNPTRRATIEVPGDGRF